MSALLEIQNVTAGYTEDITILHNITVRVEEGHLVGLIGLNGAGKSTILKSIYGFVIPSNGRVFLGGKNITGTAPHMMIERSVWYIPQESGLFAYLSVEDNLRVLARRLKSNGKSLPKTEISSRIGAVLEEFPELRMKRRQQAGDLSGGQQKMLEFAKALLARPRLCLIDEPVVGLAPKIAEEIYGWIKKFVDKKMTIFLVDHNVRRVVQMADYIYVLSLGRITAEGPSQDFKADLHQQVKQWLGINL